MLRHTRLLLAFTLLLAACGGSDEGETPLTFDGPSTDLKRTVILATLDQPIPEGKNAIWCGSFEAAWKELIDFAAEPLALEGDPPLAKALNDAPDLRPAIPAESLFSTAGEAVTILKDIQKNVPDPSPWVTSAFREDMIAAYAYINAEVPFATPYATRKSPLVFNDSRGEKSNLISFNIGGTDHEVQIRMREQARVVPLREEYVEAIQANKVMEFAIDLCVTSDPSQLTVAVIRRESTLRDAFQKVHEAVAAAELEIQVHTTKTLDFQIREIDEFAVPDLAWKTAHRFSELEGLRTNNASLKSMPLEFAGQEILFRLGRHGAKLRSEAGVAALEEAVEEQKNPQSYALNRPFLIYMKKRGADQPYFAMWVDNAELLQPWKQ